MKYCKNCGKELMDDAVVCVNCGCQAETIRPISTLQNSGTKFCSHCGKELLKEAVICTGCGCSVKESAPVQNVKVSGLAVAAKVFFIISTVVMGLYILPLVWCIPMTVSYSGKIKRGEKVGVGFKICLLIFVNLIGGILALCDNSSNEN